MPRLLFLLALCLAATCAHAQSIATNSPTPLSTRVVDYTIDAHVDPARHTLDASETLTYHNLTGQPLTTFPFHLYLNAFQPQSTFTTETHFSGGPRDAEEEDSYPARKLGSITLTRLEVSTNDPLSGPDNGCVRCDMLSSLHFVSPDDNNANDRTVAVLTLPRPVAPGGSITFNLTFHDIFPESVARNGYKRDFLMGGQWYPKLGVFWHGAWNCHQYHADTEFFSDFATFDVRLTLPTNYTVGASGVPVASVLNADGTRTLGFYGEDIHDFAFATSPHFNVLTSTYLSSLGPVQVRVLTLAAHPAAGPRYRDILLASLKQFEQRYGPYPYKILTLVDPEPGSEIGGMEYPTLVTGDASLLDPTYLQEETAEHEFGHQYWYGMVATNEFEDAWLDEGINSYTEAEVLAAILGARTDFFGRRWANFSDRSNLRLEYLSVPAWDPVTRYAWRFHNSNSYAGVTYGKSAVLLETLESLIGHDTMAEVMRTYFQRYKFEHPTTEDFLRTIEEVAIAHGRATGTFVPFAPQALPAVSNRTPEAAALRDLGYAQLARGPQGTYVNSSLRPFFNQAIYGTAILDYAVTSIDFSPAKWWLPENDPAQTAALRSSVTVHRIGDFILPVEVEVRFSDGTRVLEHWVPGNTNEPGAPGENTRWHTFHYTGTAHPVSAEIDPSHAMPLDVDEFNNSRTVAANRTPATKLGVLWMSTLQSAGQFASWLI